MKEKHTTDKIRIKGESGRFILFDPDSWQEIWITITQNRLRSFLTAFGIFWGIFMLVVMVGLGTGIQNSATSSLGHIAANTTLIFPSETTIPYKGFQKGRYWEFTTDDQFVMDKEFGDIEYQSAFIFGSSNDNNTVRKDKYGSYRVIGLEPQFNKIAPAKILKGRFLNELDIKEARKVCVVGTRVVNDLYGEEEDPIGTMLRINNIYYMVVGVAEAYSSNVNIFGNVEEQVNIPISTLQRSMNKGNKIDGLAVTAYEDKIGRAHV